MAKLPARSRWKKHDLMKMPLARPGCYVVYIDGVLVYVGQSRNVKGRICSHDFNYGMGGSVRTPWGYFTDVYFKVRYTEKYGDWAMIELRLIKRLQPKFNCLHGPKRRTENILNAKN